MPSAFSSPSLSQPVPSRPRRLLPALPFLVAALILAVLALVDWDAVSPVDDVYSDDVTLPPCNTGRPQVTIPVLDVSSSVIDRGGADPDGHSFEETRLLARALREAPCSRDDRFGAVIFAGDAVEMPPTLVSSTSIIERNLVRPPVREIGSGTDLLRALDLTDQVASRYPEADVTVVVLSDMEVSNPSAVEERLATLPVSHIHLIGLGSHDRQYDSRFDSVIELARVTKGTVATALVEAVGSTRLAEAAAPTDIANRT